MINLFEMINMLCTIFIMIHSSSHKSAVLFNTREGSHCYDYNFWFAQNTYSFP